MKPDDELLASYEQLRQDALSLPTGRAPTPGLVLFLRKGMTAWMQAWSPCRQPAIPDTVARPSAPPLGSFEVRVQIATILVGMILQQQRGGNG
jgi:hypothetical protein